MTDKRDLDPEYSYREGHGDDDLLRHLAALYWPQLALATGTLLFLASAGVTWWILW